jgi:hypothetical protein
MLESLWGYKGLTKCAYMLFYSLWFQKEFPKLLQEWILKRLDEKFEIMYKLIQKKDCLIFINL